MPFVDFHSKPVILRHINAYLLRKFYVESHFINNNNVVTKDVIHFFCDCEDNYRVGKIGIINKGRRINIYKVYKELTNGMPDYANLPTPTDEFCNPKENDIYTMFINQLANYHADAIPDALVRDTDVNTTEEKIMQYKIQKKNR